MPAEESFAEFEILSEQLLLLCEKAILWPRAGMLMIADLHLGKAGHFRKHGLPVNASVNEESLVILSEMVIKHKVSRVMVLGDLFHSRENAEWEILGDWLRYHRVKMELIKGNHDVLPVNLYEDYGIKVHSKTYSEAPFFFIHDPMKDESKIPEGYFALSGHVHPAVSLSGKARQAVRLECFCFTRRQGILPAFGKFTGNEIVRKSDYANIFVIAEGQVLKL